MAKNKTIYSVANTIHKLHIQSNLHLIYRQNFCHDKQHEIDEKIYKYCIPLLNNIDHTTLIEKWKRNIDDAAYDFFKVKK